MTVPSSEELQRLLDEATPGDWQFQDHEEWEHIAGPEYPPQKVMTEHVVEVDGVPLFWSYNDDLLEDYPGNLRIAALSRDLAAEVIRLREENDRLTRIEWLAEQAAESDSGLAYDLDHINREYEGDQE